MPFGPNSRAVLCARPRNANLPIAKAAESGNPLTLALAPVSRIAPCPCGTMRRAACCTVRKAPKAEISIALRTASGIDLGDRAGRPGARIVEDDIGRAEPRVGFLEELRDRRRVGRIGGEALGPRLGGERRELIDVARRQTELEAGCRQRASN